MSKALRSGVCLVGSPPERMNLWAGCCLSCCFLSDHEVFFMSMFSSPQIERCCWTVRGRVRAWR